MPSRRILPLAALAAIALPAMAPATAWAATEQAFTQSAFAAAQHQGKPILVEIDASWCPTCAQQRPILARLMNDPAFASLVIYKVDFDRQKPVVKEMGATMQSTLVVFHGTDERGRSVGATDPAAIRALLEKANS
jgi:thiol-disulfide isomerase/thioredoxin